MPKTCPQCKGSGEVPGMKGPVKCPVCRGSGKVPD
jgi:DnaJ-class molecular chaperone